MTTVGSGKYTYELVESWAKLPAGETFCMVSAVATDSQHRVYGFQRKDPPIIIFNRDGSSSSAARAACPDSVAPIRQRVQIFCSVSSRFS